MSLTVIGLLSLSALLGSKKAKPELTEEQLSANRLAVREANDILLKRSVRAKMKEAKRILDIKDPDRRHAAVMLTLELSLSQFHPPQEVKRRMQHLELFEAFLQQKAKTGKPEYFRDYLNMQEQNGATEPSGARPFKKFLAVWKSLPGASAWRQKSLISNTAE